MYIVSIYINRSLSLFLKNDSLHHIECNRKKKFYLSIANTAILKETTFQDYF